MNCDLPRKKSSFSFRIREFGKNDIVSAGIFSFSFRSVSVSALVTKTNHYALGEGGQIGVYLTVKGGLKEGCVVILVLRFAKIIWVGGRIALQLSFWLFGVLRQRHFGFDQEIKNHKVEN